MTVTESARLYHWGHHRFMTPEPIDGGPAFNAVLLAPAPFPLPCHLHLTSPCFVARSAISCVCPKSLRALRSPPALTVSTPLCSLRCMLCVLWLINGCMCCFCWCSDGSPVHVGLAKLVLSGPRPDSGVEPHRIRRAAAPRARLRLQEGAGPCHSAHRQLPTHRRANRTLHAAHARRRQITSRSCCALLLLLPSTLTLFKRLCKERFEIANCTMET